MLLPSSCACLGSYISFLAILLRHWRKGCARYVETLASRYFSMLNVGLSCLASVVPGLQPNQQPQLYAVSSSSRPTQTSGLRQTFRSSSTKASSPFLVLSGPRMPYVWGPRNALALSAHNRQVVGGTHCQTATSQERRETAALGAASARWKGSA